MTPKLKKIIAREGLIILVIIIISVIVGDRSFHYFWTKVAPNITVYPYYGSPTYGGSILRWLGILFGIYFLYWLIRFIIWAIRILKEK